MTLDVHEVSLPAGSLNLSGLLAIPARPVATVIALHGGGMTAGYFHGTQHPSLSLLRLGSQLGYTVLALDRPGYGAAADAPASAISLTAQAELVWQAVSASPMVSEETPILLVGHSFGSMVALEMVRNCPAGLSVRGIDFNGIGTRYADGILAPTSPAEVRRMHWGPEVDYPAGTFDRANMPTARLPRGEAEVASDWPNRVSDVASAVRCPVRITVAEGEMNWSNAPEELASKFFNAASVQLDVQPQSGHNISLSWAARAHHLRTFAFFDDCVRMLQLKDRVREV